MEFKSLADDCCLWGIDFFEGCIKGSVNPKLVSYPESAVPEVKSPRMVASIT